MSRSERLLDLLNALRRRRRPVSGRALAEEMGVSLRTLYRDIASLQAQGATIEGEPGVGYVLKPGYLLPPLMFTPEEVEALVLGSRWVADRADARMRDAALGRWRGSRRSCPRICATRWRPRPCWSCRGRRFRPIWSIPPC
ncbi:helix-turn-helix transcriptional regulator [Brevundimonas aurantiaca]|uniref:helix-turn-helix transcriptional regulator n=1 Tax=Brevundimonas aurantiaca TaxID=74316 RepID=UPI001CD6D85C|nr:HTH domain-containing protein [Brevundimonas aurantiaca]